MINAGKYTVDGEVKEKIGPRKGKTVRKGRCHVMDRRETRESGRGEKE
jgi:hypothetical protein